MQTSVKQSNGASAAGVATRFNTVRAFFQDRGVRHYMSVFTAFGLDLDDQEVTMWWNGRKRVTPKDEKVVAKMEEVVEQLKAA